MGVGDVRGKGTCSDHEQCPGVMAGQETRPECGITGRLAGCHGRPVGHHTRRACRTVKCGDEALH